ncbi:hypothetical protein BS50DRAFT_480965 [Corynespora cassiicola Philippines]|uniref:F-box domain-containing protein n=1 Tax=Corynespora cassiicola Philippines TaxID=1448308 RepID=A0A2T2PA81_CORCC|nr:hypothetical protein BS50DRAFT_480965 [Corynespora cassiicola Philippines]
MLDAPPLAPARPRQASHSNPAASAQNPSSDPTFSLLLSLPRELRERIYTFALVSPYPFWWPAPSTPKHNVALGLLTANRQVYEEAAPIFYSGNKFLFTHPSDCNIFRIVASPFSENITQVYFRIREKDLRLWATYLGSKTKERSLKADLPKLRSLWIFLRCGTMGLPPVLQAQVQAVQNALGHQFPQPQSQTGNDDESSNADDSGDGNQLPPPPPTHPLPFVTFTQGHQPHGHHNHPPAPQPHFHGHQQNVLPQQLAHQWPQATAPAQHQQGGHHVHHQHHHHHPFYHSFLRWEREMGLENLCCSLRDTRPVDADIKIVCIMRLPKPEVTRLVGLYPQELAVDRNGDARTRFRKLYEVEVSLELSGYEIGQN